MNMRDVQVAVHRNARNKGFHPDDEPERTYIANQCNNMHAEVTELWDAWRAGKEVEPCDKAAAMEKLGLPMLTTTEEELADIVIRAMDVAARLGVDIESVVWAKHQYNLTRPHKHGKLN